MFASVSRNITLNVFHHYLILKVEIKYFFIYFSESFRNLKNDVRILNSSCHARRIGEDSRASSLGQFVFHKTLKMAEDGSQPVLRQVLIALDGSEHSDRAFECK